LRTGAATQQGLDPYNEQIRLAALRLRMAEDVVTAAVERWMIYRPGKWLRRWRRRSLLDAILKYRAAGGKTAIVSDYPARRKLAAMGVADLFDVVVACGEADGACALKPHPAGLLRAAERLGISPTDCLVIGDRLDADGEGARRAGAAFIHVTSLATG
jgi:FMN phosphatase YigB (HAD superfamily)